MTDRTVGVEDIDVLTAAASSNPALHMHKLSASRVKISNAVFKNRVSMVGDEKAARGHQIHGLRFLDTIKNFGKPNELTNLE